MSANVLAYYRGLNKDCANKIIIIYNKKYTTVKIRYLEISANGAIYHLVIRSLPSNSLHRRVCLSIDILARIFFVIWMSRTLLRDMTLLEDENVSKPVLGVCVSKRVAKDFDFCIGRFFFERVNCFVRLPPNLLSFRLCARLCCF